ncbi:hypothetical protein [Erythrobacter ani]|uniref:Uncharacterized protein n=1 Tax=Erythrobacter ani TaxID=2827235 RepID=A0ABS6SSU1_9SPHN|nr:hypothetical protein [Erythrobacter ani]MBV7267557.1 hypothetical protein [Erythrobacter ani]
MTRAPVSDGPEDQGWFAAFWADCEWLAERFGGEPQEYLEEIVGRVKDRRDGS